MKRPDLKPTGASDAKDRVHPKISGPLLVSCIRKQCLRLVLKPFLITKKQKYDYHRCVNQVVIQVVFEEAELSQKICFDRVRRTYRALFRTVAARIHFRSASLELMATQRVLAVKQIQ